MSNEDNKIFFDEDQMFMHAADIKISLESELIVGDDEIIQICEELELIPKSSKPL